jgi:tetratricopeptide (TPR) repeat protein
VDHPSEIELVRYAFDPAAYDGRAQIEEHVASCTRCRKTVEFSAALDDQLRDPFVWDEFPAPAVVASLRAHAAQIVREDAEAEALLGKLTPTAAAWTKRFRNSRNHTGGVVRWLTRRARGLVESRPLDALTFADQAVYVADSLREDQYIAGTVFELRGSAWKQRADALRYLGRFDLAHDALDRAAAAYRRLRHPDRGLASVDFIRAAILFEQQRYDDAARLADRAERAFAHLRLDDDRMRAMFLRANIRYEQLQLTEATTAFHEVLAWGEALQDAYWIASGAQGLGNCYLDRGNVGEASFHLRRALLLFRELDMESDCVRTEWGIGRIRVALGHYADAILCLHEAAARFERLGMITDAALVGLDVADALMAAGRTREISPLASHLFEVFREAGMLTGALTALAYLKEAAADGTLTPEGVDSVRRFLRRAERQPDLLFAPPAP